MRDSAVRVKTTSFSTGDVGVGLAGAAGPGRQHHPLVERARGRRAPRRARRSSSGRVISVRNPRLPKLTPRIGTSRPAAGDAVGHAEQRAVAAEHDHQVDRGRPGRRATRPAPAAPASSAARCPALEHGVDAARRRASARELGQRVAGGRRGRGLATMPMRMVACGQRGRGAGAAGTRGCPCAPVIGDGVDRQARPSYRSRLRRHLGDDARVHARDRGRRPWPTSRASGLELRLHQRDDVGARR